MNPLLDILSGNLSYSLFSPLIIILYLERCDIKTALIQAGVKKEEISRSILLGLGTLTITATLTLIIWWDKIEPASAYWYITMFFEAFNEEFLFRGFLLLYILKITNLKVAYSTSVLAFILVHPQHLASISLIIVIAQAILLGIVTYKTENLIGPWISHGLNRATYGLIAIISGI